LTPLSPTTVSNPSGNIFLSWTKFKALAYLQASSRSSIVGSTLRPYPIFSLIEPENNQGSY